MGEEPAIAARRLALLKYFLPCILVFGMYAVAFHPGLFSEDSYILWRQITGNGTPPPRQAAFGNWYAPLLEQRFNSFLPLANTLTCWLAIQFWRSPSAICLLQILALAGVFAHAMVRLEARGLARWVGVLLTVGFVAFPLHGFYAVTLWKDVLYGAALLWLTVLVWEIAAAEAGFAWPGKFAPLAVASAAVWLGRPNGPAPVLLTFAALALLCRRQLFPLAAAAVVTAALVFVVRVPLSRWVGENHDGEGFYQASPFIYDVGAVLHRGGTVSGRERDVLGQFDDVDEWRTSYRPYLFPYWRGARSNWRRLDQPGKLKEFFGVWASIAFHNPGIVLSHRFRTAKLAWSLSPDGLYVIPVDAANQPARGALSLDSQPPASALTRALTAVAKATIFSPVAGWFFTCPATWMYLILILGTFHLGRSGSPWQVLFLVPVIANWFASAAFCMAPDVRYLYPGFLIAPFVVGVALLPAASGGAAGVRPSIVRQLFLAD